MKKKEPRMKFGVPKPWNPERKRDLVPWLGDLYVLTSHIYSSFFFFFNNNENPHRKMYAQITTEAYHYPQVSVIRKQPPDGCGTALKNVLKHNTHNFKRGLLI